MYLIHTKERMLNNESLYRNMYESEIKRLNEKIAKMDELFEDKLLGIIENEYVFQMNESNNGSIMTTLDQSEINKYFILDTENKEIEETVLSKKLLKEHFSSEETFYCKICYNLVVNVTQCSNCEILFCKKCIELRTKENEKCPGCKAPFSEGFVPRITKNILNNFNLQCPYLCDEYIKYSGIFSHLNKCNNRGKIFICRECDEKVLIPKQNEDNFERKLIEHMENCPEKITDCKNCKQNMKKRELFLHNDTCEERTIKCEKCCFVYPFKMTLTSNHDIIHCIEIRRLRKNLELFVKKNGL